MQNNLTQRCMRSIACGLAGVALAASTASAQLCENISNRVNLEWRSDESMAMVGDTIDLDLFAVSADGISNEPMSALQILLQWDPEKLQLLGNVDNGPYEWLDTLFPNDSGLDGLNAPFGEVPGNDGDCRFDAYQQLAPPPFGPGPALATPDGLLVTTFRFRVLGPSVMTMVSIPEELGQFSVTAVASGIVAGCDIKGTLGASEVRTIPAQLGDGDGDDDLDLLDFGRLQDCATGNENDELTDGCVAFDFDIDDDIDLDDFSAFEDARNGE